MSALDARLDAFAAAIAAARDIAAAGGLLDLNGLDDAATEICSAVKLLPSGARRAAAERLAAIGAGLDALATALRAQPEPVREGPGSRHTRAGRAYRPVGSQSGGHPPPQTGGRDPGRDG